MRRQWTRTTKQRWSFDAWWVVQWLHCSCQLFVQILWWSTFFERGGLVVVLDFRTHFSKKLFKNNIRHDTTKRHTPHLQPTKTTSVWLASNFQTRCNHSPVRCRRGVQHHPRPTTPTTPATSHPQSQLPKVQQQPLLRTIASVSRHHQPNQGATMVISTFQVNDRHHNQQ